MRRGTAAMAGIFLAASASPALPAEALLKPYTTAECFAFWTLQEKLNGDGVPALLARGPKGSDGGLPKAEMERVTLYLDLEEKLRFRCPDFAPPPDRAPGKQKPGG